MSILPQLEQDLYRAAQGRMPRQPAAVTESASGSTLKRRLNFASRAALLGASLAVSVLVALVALTALHHRPTPAKRPAVNPPSPARVRTSRRALIDSLAVLHTGPAASRAAIEDALPGILRVVSGPRTLIPSSRRSLLARIGNPEVDWPLARLVGFPKLHTSVALIPVTYEPSRSAARAEGLVLGLLTQSVGSFIDGAQEQPVGVQGLRSHGLVASNYARDGNLQIVVVPNGVFTVTIGPIHLVDGPPGTRGTEFAPVTTTVRDNVAAFRLDFLTQSTLHMQDRDLSRFFAAGFGGTDLYGLPAVADMTWSSRSGAILKRHRVHFTVYVAVRRRPAKPG